MMEKIPFRVAIIDLYDNAPNQGMRSIQTILDEFGQANQVPIEKQIFETRYKNEIPDNDFDIYISSGGPGNPFDGEGKSWEKNYFNLVDSLLDHNQKADQTDKKHMFFICHSFQLMCRHFGLALVSKRRTSSFGIFPCHLTDQGMQDSLFGGLSEPFYVADSRDWQCTDPDITQLERLGAQVLALEKKRPTHPQYKRAVMALRLTDEFLGTQFHPEADPEGMSIYFNRPEKKKQIIKKHGQEKYDNMIAGLLDNDNIHLTHDKILPGFLAQAWQKKLATELVK